MLANIRLSGLATLLRRHFRSLDLLTSWVLTLRKFCIWLKTLLSTNRSKLPQIERTSHNISFPTSASPKPSSFATDPSTHYSSAEEARVANPIGAVDIGFYGSLSELYAQRDVRTTTAPFIVPAVYETPPLVCTFSRLISPFLQLLSLFRIRHIVWFLSLPINSVLAEVPSSMWSLNKYRCGQPS